MKKGEEEHYMKKSIPSGKKHLEADDCTSSPWTWWIVLLVILLSPIWIVLLIPYLVLCVIILPVKPKAIGESREKRIKRFHFHKQLKEAGRFLNWKQACKRIEKEGGTLISYGYANHIWWTPDDVIKLSPYSPHTDRENYQIQNFMKMAPPEGPCTICFNWDQWCAEHYISRKTGNAFLLHTRKPGNIVKKLTSKFPNLKHVSVFNPSWHTHPTEENASTLQKTREPFWDESSPDPDLPAPWYLNRFLFAFLATPIAVFGMLFFIIFLIAIGVVYLLGTLILISFHFMVARLSETLFRWNMRKKKRLITTREAEERLRSEGGTLLLEPRCFRSQSERLWWTPDDVLTLSPHPLPSQADRNFTWLLLRFNERLPGIDWENWCWETYTSPDTGRALLIKTWDGQEQSKKLEKIRSDIQVARQWLHQPSYQRQQRKK